MHQPDLRPSTLGALLYANREKATPPEQEWVGLVKSVAAGDQSALRALYERAHQLVFMVAVRITRDRQTAEELTVDVFHDILRQALKYDPAGGTVLGWILNHARERAIDRLRLEGREKRGKPQGHNWRQWTAPPNSEDAIALRQDAALLRRMLTVLASDEKQAIEATYFLGLTYEEVAERLNEPLGTIKTRIRSGLSKLREGLAAGVPRSPGGELMRCGKTEAVGAYVIDTLPPGERAALEAHVAECKACRQELEWLIPIADILVTWPSDVLRPPAPLRERVARSILAATGTEPVLPADSEWKEPEWEGVAPGIFCKILATDTERDRVTMLVRLLPDVSYPPHTHAGVEELHLLDGELWIDDRLLYPGDYNFGEPGTSDQRVYSETGCTCVLITSPSDVLR